MVEHGGAGSVPCFESENLFLVVIFFFGLTSDFIGTDVNSTSKLKYSSVQAVLVVYDILAICHAKRLAALHHDPLSNLLRYTISTLLTGCGFLAETR